MIAVVASDEVEARLGGFDCVVINRPNHTQSDSLRAGIACAQKRSADRVIVALADMPKVTTKLLNDVLVRAGPEYISALTDGLRRTPPACFPKSHFPEMMSLEEDRGAGKLLRRIPEDQLVRVASAVLMDIDVPADLGDIAEDKAND